MKGFRRAKRWLALLLAITLAFSNTAFTDVPAVVRADDGVSDGTEAAAPAAVEEPVVIEESADTWDGGETASSDDTWEDGENAFSDETAEPEDGDEASPDETPEDGETTPPDGIPADGDTASSDDIETPEPAPGFEPIPIPVGEKNVLVKFAIEGKGNVKVSISDRELPSEINGRESGFLVTEDSTVTFTAQADAGYSIGEVTVDGSKKSAASRDGDAYTYEITADADKSVNISFVKDDEEGEDEDNADEDDIDIEDTDAEEPAEYKVTIDHILHTDNYGDLCTTKAVTLTAEDFKDGSADLMSYIYNKEGMVCDTNKASVSKADFTDGHAKATIYYSVAKGWKAVWVSGIMTLSVFRGKIEDVELKKDESGTIPVQISFIYENGDRVELSNDYETVAYAEAENGYTFTHPLPEIKGYRPTIDQEVVKPHDLTVYDIAGNDVDGFELVGTGLSADLESDKVRVIFVGNEDIEYKIKYEVPDGVKESLDENLRKQLEEGKVKTGKAGEFTEVGSEEDDIPAITGCTAQTVIQEPIKGDGNTVINVEYVKNAYSIVYDTNGGSYTRPQKNIEYGTRAVLEGQTEKTGYKFVGWYENKDGSGEKITEFPFMDSDKTVYAKWDKTEVNYTVIYWKQIWNNTTDSAYYGFIDSEREMASVEDEISSEEFDKEFDYDYHYERNTKSDKTYTVAADGSTVVNVYYDLKEYKVKFDLNPGASSYKASMVVNGTTYYGDGEKYVINGVKIGKDLTKDWPKQENITRTDANEGKYWLQNWSGYFVGGTVLKPGSELALRLENRSKETSKNTTVDGVYTCTATWRSESEACIRRVEYWCQDVVDKNKYVLRQWVERLEIKNDGVAMGAPVGFENRKSTPDGKDENGNPYPTYTGTDRTLANGWGKDAETGRQINRFVWYCDRLPYKITYMQAAGDKAPIGKPLSAKYEQNINTKEYNFKPERPEGAQYEDAEFLGWYKDAEGDEKYDFDKMPAEDLLLYAVWERLKVTVTAHDIDPNTEKDNKEEYTITKGDSATEVKNPGERDDYIFDGWYTSDGTEFDINDEVLKDTDIYAKWVKKNITEYTIEHTKVYENGDEETIQKITQSGIIGSTITVKALNNEEVDDTWLPTEHEHEMTLVSNPSDNYFEFKYSVIGKKWYTTEYVYKDEEGNTTLLINKDNAEEKYKDKFEPQETNLRTVDVSPDLEILADLKAKGFNYDGYKARAYITPESTPSNPDVATFYLKADAYEISYIGVDEKGNPVEGFDKIAASYPDKYNAAMLYKAGGQQIVLPTPKVAHYKFLGWTTDATDVEGNTFKELQDKVIIDLGSKGDIVFVAHFEQIMHEITIEVENGTHDQSAPVVSVADGSDLSIKFDPKSDSDVKYVLDTVTVVKKENGSTTYPDLTEDGTYTFKDVTDDYMIKVVYAEDKIGGRNPDDPDDPDPGYPDGIPDKYQALVTYMIENGTWDGIEGNNKPKQVVLTLKVKENGVWNDIANVNPKVPKDMKPDTGYKAEGGWNQDPTIENIKKDIREYTYSYGKDSFGYTVNIRYEDRTGTIATVVFASATKDEEKEPFGSTISYVEAVKEKVTYNEKDYLFEKVEINGAVVEKANYEEGLTITEIESQNVVDIYYTIDALSADPKNPEDPEEPDGIPDKYQALVTYKATNGTVEIQQAVVTLLDDAGNYAEIGKGTGRLSEEQIPEGTPATGFDSKTKSWGDKEPTTDYKIENDETFTVTWDKGQYHYTVKYVNEAGEEIAVPDTKGPEEYGTTVKVTNERKMIESGTSDSEVKHYALDDEATKDLTIDNDEEKNVIEFVYSLDEKGTEDPEKPDGIPDKYQATVIYQIENGTWDGQTDAAPKKYVITVANAGGPIQNVDRRVPQGMKADTGYDDVPGKWYDENGKVDEPIDHPDIVEIKGGETYTFIYKFIPNVYTLTIHYWDEEKNNLKDAVTEKVNYDDPYNAADYGSIGGEGETITYNNKNYVWEKTTGDKTEETVTGDIVIDVYYSMDEIGGRNPDDPDDPDPGYPDGIPDKYQATVIYQIVNGTWDGNTDAAPKKYVITVANAEGPIQNVDRKVPQDMKAKTGYTQKDGQWYYMNATVESWSDVGLEGGKEYVFTYKYVPNEHTITIYYVSDGGKELAETVSVGMVYGTNYDVSGYMKGTDDYIDNDDGHYIWEENDGPVARGPVPDESFEIYVKYTLDNIGGGNSDDPDDPDKPDGIPDKYQATVIYRIENGTWKSKNNAKPRKYVIQVENASGVIQDADLKIPGDMTPDTGYDVAPGMWYDKDENEVKWTETALKGNETYTFTYKYDPNQHTITINYVSDDGSKILKPPYTENVVYATDYNVTDKAGKKGESIKDGGDNYIWEKNDGVLSGPVPDKDIVINVIYTLDNFGRRNPGGSGDIDDPDNPGGGSGDPDDPDNPGGYPGYPDDIPDKYQAIVTYKIENGTWDGEDSADRIVVINLYEEPEVQGGEWTKIPEPDRQIPKGMSGNRGYTVDNGWDEDPSEAEITGGNMDYVFTYSYGIGTFGYTVNYHYGDSIETTSGRARYGAVVSYDTTSPKGYNGQSYILDNVKIGGAVVTDYSRGLTITDNAGKNVADVYYTLNGAGGGEPGDPEEPGNPEDPEGPGPEPTPDTTPDNITPAVITAAPAPITAVPQAVVPTADNNLIGEEDVPLAAGSDGSVTIGEEAVPLASKPEEIMCCILHLLVMCVAMLVELYYFHDRKKRQKKEREVRLELGK